MRGKSKILRKLTAALLLNVFSFNILADGLQVDPNSRYNTSLDRAQNGVPVVNISTPNGRGVSINEFLEYNVGREGQVLNNADNIGRSHLAGIINANPNLGPNQAANLILLQVNGANRSQIEGYIEALSRQKVNVILSNENGIYLNGAGTINIKNFIPTTGKVKLKDGDVIGIDVEKGRVIIGAGGFDATNTDYVNVIAKAMELQGNLVGNKVDITLGENAVDSNGTVTSKNGINSVAIDASNLGSMYAGQIKIVSTDKGAGVNSNGLIYSRDTKLEITADGKINVAKIKGNGIEINGTEYAQSELASSDKGININAAKIKLDGQTQANEDINLNGNVENKSNIYAGGNLNTLDMINSGNINASGNITAKDFRNSLATVLSRGNFNVKNLDNSGNIQVSGITDILVEINGNELPILDGSSIQFMEKLKEAGIKELESEIEPVVITEPIIFTQEKDGKHVLALPYDGFKISYTIDFNHSFLKSQYFEINVTPEEYIEKISRCRTFAFDYEIDFLKKNNLALGGSLENAIVVGKDGPLNPEGLRYPDEFVRHKILDIIGDLYVLGRPLKAHVIAIKAGHFVNAKLTALIAEKYLK